MSLGIRQLREFGATIVLTCCVVACGTGDTFDTTLADDDPAAVAANVLVFDGALSLNGQEVPIAEQMGLRAGDEIASDDDRARALISLGNEYTIELFKRASLRVVELTPPEIGIFLYSGHINIKDTDETTSRIRIDTDGAGMETVGEGGAFTVCQPPSNDTCMIVHEGVVELTSGGVTKNYSPGEGTVKTAIFVVKDNPPAPERCVPTQDYDQWFELARLNQGELTLGQLVNRSPMCGAEVIGVGVPGTQLWTDTGIDLSVGDMLAFEAHGSIKPGENTVFNGPEGNPELDVPSNVAGLEEENHAALIAMIGPDGPPFLVGPLLAGYPVETDGRLYLGINDVHVENNEGSFAVIITVTRLPADS